MSLRRGQMTIFIIIAIVIVAGIIVYFLARGELGAFGVSSELQPVFDYYEECLRQETRSAIELAESQGGFVEVLDYAPGSEYAPFSSQLNFLGFPIPYWYYVSGNGLIKEQIPLMSDIEGGISEYVGERLNECDFDNFYAQGFSIDIERPNNLIINVEDENVNVIVDSNLVVSKGEESARKNVHEVNVESKLGKFYNIARKIYEKEKERAVFDNYGADVLRLYAPVDGVEISCSGKIWKTGDVINELKSGLEANIDKIKFKGDYYNLNDKKDEYYIVDLGENIDENVNLIYLRNMPTKIEIFGEGVDENLMIASPIGIQEGLGVLGFCYAPYHFVYDLSFPVLVQIYNNEEIFQFPIVAVIDNNVVREAIFSELGEEPESFDLCEFSAQDVEINLYDNNLNRVDGILDYQCFDQKCRLGETEEGRFVGKAPSCLNGYLLVSGEGFVEKKELFSSNKERDIDIILDREYEVEIELEIGGRAVNDERAILSFVREEESASTALPDVSKIKLSEGSYDVKVYVYGSSGITIPASKRTQCQEVPRAGILGFFGSTKEECFDIVIPETKIEYALRGGGSGNVYITESQLADGKIKVSVDALPAPRSLEELQYNYASFESLGVDVE